MRYPKLRGAMRERDILQSDLAQHLGLVTQAVSHRFTGITPWTIPEAYKTLDYLRIPCDRIAEFFPPNGGVV